MNATVITVLKSPRTLKWIIYLVLTISTTPIDSFSLLRQQLPTKPPAQHPYMTFPLLYSVVPTSSESESQPQPIGPLHIPVDSIPSSDTMPTVDKGTLVSMEKQIQYFTDVIGLVLCSLLFSIVLISWEDLTCRSVLPSRHRTSISLYRPTSLKSWGMMTVRGMGFNQIDRQILFNAASESQEFEIDPLLSVPTYNEVMLHHREVTIPQWKRHPTPDTISTAIHTIIESIQQLDVLRDMANDYQWETIRSQLRNEPISDLSVQSSILRQVSTEMNDVVGFDWGSCAWRRCGAISDIQEAVDEVDQLLGVLEPHELMFCFDIMERSLRDILAVIPWQQYALENDIVFYNNLPPYVSSIHYNTDASETNDDETSLSRIDSDYIKALQELRID